MLLPVFQCVALFFFAFFLVFLLSFAYLCFVGLVCFSSLFASVSSVGFCGSRSVVPPVSSLAPVFSAVPLSASVSVGCARGFDCFVRGCFPLARVFSVASFGSGRRAFARRSSAFVSALASSPAPLLVGAPAVSCPAGLFPSPSSSVCFRGLGSGSWASLALALGLGCRVLVFLPVGVVPPAGWGFVSSGGGWWFASPVQRSLF